MPRLIAYTVALTLLSTGGFIEGCGSGDSQTDGAVQPDALAKVDLTYDNLVEACVRLAACEVERTPRLGDCLDNFHVRYAYYGRRALYEALYDCVNKSQGECGDIRQCVGYSRRLKTGECDQSYSSCEGDVAHNCDLVGGGYKVAIPCAKGGLKCALRDTGGSKSAACTTGTCDKTFKARCEDRKLLTCVGGAIQINDCPAQQLQCRDPEIGLCEGTGRSCPAASTSPVCSGNVLVSCDQNYLTAIDCTKVYGKKKCDVNTVKCGGAGAECDVGGVTTFNDCEGDTLVACIDGTRRRYDCKKLGFLGCEKATTGYGAYCKAEPVYE